MKIITENRNNGLLHKAYHFAIAFSSLSALRCFKKLGDTEKLVESTFDTERVTCVYVSNASFKRKARYIASMRAPVAYDRSAILLLRTSDYLYYCYRPIGASPVVDTCKGSIEYK